MCVAVQAVQMWVNGVYVKLDEGEGEVQQDPCLLSARFSTYQCVGP